MKPLTGGYSTDTNMPATQNFLAYQRHLYCVVYVVIGGIAGRDIFKRETCDKTNNARIAWLKYPIGLLVHGGKLACKISDHCLGGVEHSDHLIGGYGLARFLHKICEGVRRGERAMNFGGPPPPL